MSDQNLYFAVGMTFIAGMATALGSSIAFFMKGTNYRFLSISTGFSAGAMLYVSFSELLPASLTHLSTQYGDHSRWLHLFAFFGGMALIGIIDAFVPVEENPHEIQNEATLRELKLSCSGIETKKKTPKSTATRTGIFLAFAIGIHNVPEGLATFFSSVENFQMGVTIAVAVALHNIPEGISVSVPIFYATLSKRKAFVYSALTGLAEPVGALIFYGTIKLLFRDLSGLNHVLGYMLGMVAGIMVYVSIDELLPVSRAYGKGHDSLIGFVTGMGFTAVGLAISKIP